MRIKTFKDLIEEVHKPGICQECGGCVSFCNSIKYDAIGFKKPNSPPEYLNEDKCLECGICYFICPQTHILDEDLNKTYNFSDSTKMPLGFIDSIYSCQSLDDEFLKYGTDGGVVNSIINYLIEKNFIEGAIVAKTTSPFNRESIIARNKKDLIGASGVKLDITPQLEIVQKFHTYTSSLPSLRHYKFKKIALVGTPCQIYTIRCMQELGIIPSENIEICLGLFCYENFFFNKKRVEKFEQYFNLKFTNIERVNIKENLIINIKNKKNTQKTIHIPFEKLTDYTRPACSVCKDFTNIYADISFGGLGSQDKYTTVITRTKKGEEIINKALRTGVIKRFRLDSSKLKELKEKLIHFTQLKLKRTEKNMRDKMITGKSLSGSSITNKK